MPRYARWVSIDEIADAKNAFNLNLPRYIDATDPEDLQDIEGHLKGGISERDIDDLADFWQIMPAVRATLFTPADRPRYHQLRLPLTDVKAAILEHPEFRAFTTKAATIFDDWRTRTRPKLEAFTEGSPPKELIADIAEDLLDSFRKAPLIDAYDIYQHLMTFWNEVMQDDCYLISGVGWTSGARVREIIRVKNKDGKLGWPEPGDYQIGRRRFASDLIPSRLIIARFFAAEQAQIDEMDARIAQLEQVLQDRMEEGSGEEGLLSEVIEGEGDKQKITAKAIKARLKDDIEPEERKALKDYAQLLELVTHVKSARNDAEVRLYQMVHERFTTLTEAEVKALVIEDKWLAKVQADVQAELDRVSQRLTGRVKDLAERYARPLPELEAEVASQSSRVVRHLRAMGLSV